MPAPERWWWSVAGFSMHLKLGGHAAELHSCDREREESWVVSRFILFNRCYFLHIRKYNVMDRDCENCRNNRFRRVKAKGQR